MTQGNWFQTFKHPGASANSTSIRLYTFHHAGGACQYFQPWAAKLPEWIELVSIQLPGRWNRVNESAFLSMNDLIPVLGSEFKRQLMMNNSQPFAFYGHSLGGLVAYELSRFLIKEKLQLPVHLFISSKRSLQDYVPSTQIFHLPPEQFETVVSKMYGALPPEVAADPDFKDLFLSITKKDMQLLDTYDYTPEPKINIPLTVMRGLNDHIITFEIIEAWKDLTTANCELIEFPGGHFFLRESESGLLLKIVEVLKKYQYTNSGKTN